MKRRYTFSLAALIGLMLCLFPLSALGNPIDVEQALKAVENYRKKPARNGARRAAAFNKGKLQHAYTKSTAAGAPAVYVFNTGEGFILASADDATVPVLGYSDNGDFDPDNIPDGLKYLMGEYAKQIAALPPRKAGAALPTPTYEVEYTTPIQPLLQSHWEQQAPYNAECPNALSPSGRAATGCMTTALAQIMRYHKWPTTGYSSREQDAAQGVGTTQVVRDYYTRNYQWDLMHYYTSQYTKTTGGGFNFGASDVKAVSQLMMDIAVGLSTEFGGVSSAVNIAIVPMLLSYFNYDAGIEEVKLKDYTTEEFNHIVITDLLAGRPVYFQGGPTSAGHAFVCDGYNGEGHFHINWGWGGTSDGYFLVTGLTPSAAGTGGEAGMGYSESLLAIHNIMPCRDGVVARPEVKTHYSTPINPGYQIVKENGTTYFAGNFGVFPQTSTQQRNFRGRLGLRVEVPGSAAQTVWNEHQTYTQMLRTIPYRNFHVDFNPAWAVEDTRITYIYQECGASAALDVYNTRGDVCSFLVKKNSDGELVAVAEDIEYSLADLAPVNPATTVNVTYNIYLNGNSIGSTTVAEVVGQAPSKSFVPEYFVSATGFPTTITSSGGTYDIQSSYKTTMPFQTGTAYNVSFNVGGNTYMWCISSGAPKEQMNPSASAGNEATAQWRFDGDWFNGFTIRNWSTNTYITTTDTESSDIRTLSAQSPLSGRSYFLLQHRGDGFYFRLKDSNLCLAHTKPSSLEISVYDQKNYAGNLVTFTSPGYVPQPTGITYTVDISGLPEGETSALYYKGQSYSNGGKFNAVELTKDQLAATTIEGYDYEITIGANTVYVVYTAQPMATVTYNVSITGYPSGQNPVLYYNNQPVQGNQLVATDLSLMQLSATHIDNYTCDIRIAARNITVTYTAINYVTYNVNFTGVPTGQTAKLYYNGQEVSGTQFTAGNLVVEQLYATGITDYSYKITISGNTITVMYYPLELHFDTTTGYNNTINTLTKEPVTVRYFGYDGKNNIYIGDDHTEVNSTGEPIVKIVFENIENFGGVNASVGTLDRTTGIWTAPDGGVASVKFTGGDGFSTGLMVYLKSSDTPTPTPTTYTISFSGHPSGQSPQLYYNGEAVSGTQLTATNLNSSQLSATTIAGYSYHISIGTNTISVVYTADTPAGTTYTISIVGAPSGYSPQLYYNGEAVSGTQFTATNLSLTQLSATNIPGYSYDIVIGTSTVTVTYTAVGTTYTVSIVGALSGYTPVLNYGTSSYAHGQQFTATSLSLTQLSATSIPGYSYDIVIGTSTVTVTYTADAPAGTTYTVSIVGAPSGYSPVLNFGTSTYAHGQQFTATSLSLTQLSATTIPDYSYDIVIGTSTVTVTYTEQFPKVGVPYVLQESSGSLYLNVISDTEAGTLAGTKNVVLKSAPQALYFSSQGTGFYIQNSDGLYVGKSTANGWNMSAGTPELWTVEPVGTGYALHCERGYLGFDDVTLGGITSAGFRDKAATARAIFNITEAQSTTYNVVVSGTDNADAGVVFGGVTYHHGESIETFDVLTESSVAAAEVSGLIGTVTLSGTTFTVAYAAPSSEGYHFETMTYSSGRQYFSDGPVSGSYYPYSGKNNIYGSSWYTEVESSGEPIASIAFDNIEGFTDNGGVQPSTGSIDLSTGIWTASDASTYYVKFTGGDGYSTGLTVYLMSSGPTTYTVVVNDLPSGGAVTLNGQDLTTGGTYTVSKALSLSDLSVTEPDGYYADKTYDQSTHTFTVTFHECYSYSVVVAGTSNASAGVVYNGVTYRDGATIQSRTPLYATSVTPISITGQEGSVTFENNTFTVTYRIVTHVTWDYPTDIPVYGNGAKPKEGVTVFAQYWSYENANLFENDLANYDYGYLRLTSEKPITKVIFHVEPGKSGMETLIANAGTFTSLASTVSTWEGSAADIIFGSTSDVYVRSLDIYYAGPTEHEQALREIEAARVEIAGGSLGYPILTQKLRNDPNMAAYVAYYDNPTAYTGTLAALQASYDYFLTHTTEVNTPVAGHAYKLSVRSSDGKKRWYLTNYGTVSEAAADAAVFVMGGTGNEDYNTLFATNDNSQSHYLQNNGATATAYTADACDFALTSMLQAEQGTLVSTQPARRLGTFSLGAKARHDNADLVGVMVLNESTHSWSNSENPYMDGSYTSAIEMEEVEYPYNKPKLTAGKEGSHEGVFASIWLPFPMIFPEGVEVYKGTQQHTTAGQTYLALERVDTDHAVAKGGYILYSETLSAGEIEVLPAPSCPTDAHNTTDAVFIGSTDLSRSGEDLYWVYLNGQNPYVLADKSKGIGFYRYTGTVFPKGKAIWLAPEDESNETVRFGFEDIIEAIKALHGHGADTLIYDLQGHRLEKVEKGKINVVSGKKVIIK